MLEPENPLAEDFLQFVVGSVIVDNMELTFLMDKEEAYRRIRQNIELLLSAYVKPYVISSESGGKVRWLCDDDLRSAVDEVLEEILDEWYGNPLVRVFGDVIRLASILWVGGVVRGEGV